MTHLRNFTFFTNRLTSNDLACLNVGLSVFKA